VLFQIRASRCGATGESGKPVISDRRLQPRDGTADHDG
jgi:hypothetical protein